MKILGLGFALSLLLGTSSNGDSVSVGVSDLVMPVSEHPNLSAVELVLKIDDMSDPPAAVPNSLAQILKELGVVSAANATYTWGDPDGLLLIDANIHRFATAETARKNVLGNLDGLERIEGVGDAATMFGGQSLSFSVGAVKVTLTTISDEVDVMSVAETYADWLKSRPAAALQT